MPCRQRHPQLTLQTVQGEGAGGSRGQIDPGGARQVRQGRGRRLLGRHDDEPGLVQQWDVDHAPRRRGQRVLVTLDEDQVELTATQAGQGVALLGFLDDHLQLGAGGRQRAQEGQQERPDGGGEAPDTHHTGGDGVVQVRQLAAHGGQLVLDALGRVRQNLPGRREHGSGGRAIQDPGAALAFQEANLLGDRRRRYMKEICRCDDSSGSMDGQ